MAQVTIDARDTRFYISLVPAMPVVELTARGADGSVLPGAACNWTFVLDYPGFITVPQGFRRNGRAYRHPPIAAATGNPVRVPFAIVTGGQLTATVTASIGGRPATASRSDILIGGTNPGGTDLSAAVPDMLMRQMIQQESGGAQFNDGRAGLPAQAINPNWSQDNLRGVGLGQLTNPPPTADEVWNWRINAASLQSRYRDKKRSGASLHTRVMASARFQAEVAALAEWRRAESLPPIRVSLPALTGQQQDREGLRAYNGFGRKVADQYLDHIHEYEPTLTLLTSATRRDPAGRALTSPPVPVVDANGVGSWTQISGAERNGRSGGQAPGDPDYVAHVLARPG